MDQLRPQQRSSLLSARPTREVCITVDMEPDCPPYLSTWRGITEGAPMLFDLFAAEAIPVTYFVTGETAERHPGSIKALVAAGHELACHGMTHRPFEQLSNEEAAWEISAATRGCAVLEP